MALMKSATLASNKVSSLAPVLDAGGYAARIVQIVDLGKQAPQPGSQYQNPSYKMFVRFECLDEFMVEQDEAGNPVMEQDPDEEPGVMIPKVLKDKPRWFDSEFSYNPDGYISENANLFKLLTAIDAMEVKPNELFPEGKPAKDTVDWLTEPLMINLIQQVTKNGKNAGKMKNVVTGFAAMKGKDKKTAPALVNPTTFFNLGEPDLEVFSKLSSGSVWTLQEKIKANLEFPGSKLAELLGITTAKAPVDNKATDAEVEAQLAAEMAAQAAAKEAAKAETPEGETPADGGVNPF